MHLGLDVYDRFGAAVDTPFSYNRMRAMAGVPRQYTRDPIYESCPQQFNRLKLMEKNDTAYLDKFMSPPNNKMKHMTNDEKFKMILRNQYIDNKKKNNEKNKKMSPVAKKLAMLGSLSKCRSEEQLYESVEAIHYRKTLQDINKKDKTRSLQRSGHPLFDHLREEQALFGPKKTPGKPKYSKCSTGYPSSNGSSSTPSSSGDEFESSSSRYTFTNKPDPEYIYIASLRRNNQKVGSREDYKAKRGMSRLLENVPPEHSEEERERYSIPRPSILAGSRKCAVKFNTLPINGSSDDSSSSSKSSTLLR